MDAPHHHHHQSLHPLPQLQISLAPVSNSARSSGSILAQRTTTQLPWHATVCALAPLAAPSIGSSWSTPAATRLSRSFRAVRSPSGLSDRPASHQITRAFGHRAPGYAKPQRPYLVCLGVRQHRPHCLFLRRSSGHFGRRVLWPFLSLSPPLCLARRPLPVRRNFCKSLDLFFRRNLTLLLSSYTRVCTCASYVRAAD
jgi:hypothetical protein